MVVKIVGISCNNALTSLSYKLLSVRAETLYLGLVPALVRHSDRKVRTRRLETVPVVCMGSHDVVCY